MLTPARLTILETAIARILLADGPLPSDELRAEVVLATRRPCSFRDLGETLHHMRADMSVRVEYGPGGTHVAGPRARYLA